MIWLTTYLVGFLFTFLAAHVIANNASEANPEEIKEPYKTATCLVIAFAWPGFWLLFTAILLFGDNDE